MSLVRDCSGSRTPSSLYRDISSTATEAAIAIDGTDGEPHPSCGAAARALAAGARALARCAAARACARVVRSVRARTSRDRIRTEGGTEFQNTEYSLKITSTSKLNIY